MWCINARVNSILLHPQLPDLVSNMLNRTQPQSIHGNLVSSQGVHQTSQPSSGGSDGEGSQAMLLASDAEGGDTGNASGAQGSVVYGKLSQIHGEPSVAWNGFGHNGKPASFWDYGVLNMFVQIKPPQNCRVAKQITGRRNHWVVMTIDCLPWVYSNHRVGYHKMTNHVVEMWYDVNHFLFSLMVNYD